MLEVKGLFKKNRFIILFNVLICIFISTKASTAQAKRADYDYLAGDCFNQDYLSAEDFSLDNDSSFYNNAARVANNLQEMVVSPDDDVEQMANIGNTIWLDSDGNGIYEPQQGEAPISSVLVELYDESGNLLALTITDTHGFYFFDDLLPGQYNVVVAKKNFSAGGQLAGYESTFDYDGIDTANSAQAVLVPDENNDSIDFGYKAIISPGVKTLEYWENNPQAWPLQVVYIGGRVYSKCKALKILKARIKDDKVYDMLKALLLTKLNIAAGNNSECIKELIRQTDSWLALYIGEQLAVDFTIWQDIEWMYQELNRYNNGELCGL